MKYLIVLVYSCFFWINEQTIAVNERPVEPLTLNKENLVKTMKEMGIQHVDIVLAQAIIESGTFKSHVFKTKNNMFGMRVAKRRGTTALDKKTYHGYATYASWIDCVRDYKLYQDYVTKNKIVSRSQYLSILARSYSTSPGYVSAVEKVAVQNKKYT